MKLKVRFGTGVRRVRESEAQVFKVLEDFEGSV